MVGKERSEREPTEIHEPVTRRDERGQVVESVAVEAPDERADDLADRRDSDDRERLQSDRLRM
jgi:hypothetical protein